jgi:TctA family transporter
MDTLDFLAKGFTAALQWHNLLFCFFGVFVGTIVGVLPGIGPSSGVALLIPITATVTGKLAPEDAATGAIIMLAGVFYGAMYGGSTTSILINTPGESASVITCVDGYQMAKRGRAGPALAISAIGSFIAGMFALLMLIILAEPLADMALRFGPPEYFSLVVLGLAAITGLAGKSVPKALIMLVTGLLLSTIGVDSVSGSARFTYDIPLLYQGLEFITIAVGMFALGEVFNTIIEDRMGKQAFPKIGRVLPTLQDLKDSFMPIVRGSVMGFFIGILPGAGPTLASTGTIRPGGHRRGRRARVGQQRRGGRGVDPPSDLGHPQLGHHRYPAGRLHDVQCSARAASVREAPRARLGGDRQHVRRQPGAPDPEHAPGEAVCQTGGDPRQIPAAADPGHLHLRHLCRAGEPFQSHRPDVLRRCRLSAGRKRFPGGASGAGENPGTYAGKQLPKGVDRQQRGLLDLFNETGIGPPADGGGPLDPRPHRFEAHGA